MCWREGLAGGMREGRLGGDGRRRLGSRKSVLGKGIVYWGIYTELECALRNMELGLLGNRKGTRGLER